MPPPSNLPTEILHVPSRSRVPVRISPDNFSPVYPLPNIVAVIDLQVDDGYVLTMSDTYFEFATLQSTGSVFGPSQTIKFEFEPKLELRGLNRNEGNLTLGSIYGDIVHQDTVVILKSEHNDHRATLVNVGNIEGYGSITGDAGAKIVNNGRIANSAPPTQFDQINAGNLYLGVTIMGEGFIDVNSGPNYANSDYQHPYTAGLTIHGKISAGQTIDLHRGLLNIDDLADFHATVANFNATAEIEVNGVEASSLAYNNGALTLLNHDGGALGTIHLRRPAGASFSTADFHVTSIPGYTFITTDNTVHT